MPRETWPPAASARSGNVRTLAGARRSCRGGAGLRARPGADASGRSGGSVSASERAVNGWGGFSKATTRALQSLHYHGLLRVARTARRHPHLRSRHRRNRPAAAGGTRRRHGAAGRRASSRPWARPGWQRPSACWAAAHPGSADGGRPWQRCSPRANWKAARSMACGITGPPANAARRGCAARSAAARAIRSRSSGNAAASSICGAGRIASRPTPSRSNAGSAITRCRCCGATTSSAGQMSASTAGRLDVDARLHRRAAARSRRSAARWTPNLRRWKVSCATSGGE